MYSCIDMFSNPLSGHVGEQTFLIKMGPYLVYCHTNPLSSDGAQSLVDAAIINVCLLKGNYREWVNAGYPTEA